MKQNAPGPREAGDGPQPAGRQRDGGNASSPSPDSSTRRIWCCGCGDHVDARLTTGREIYPHRPDLAGKRFWRCSCGLYVGTHSGKAATPLGCIPTEELKRARGHIHAVLDPLWKSGRFSRADLYKAMSDRTGREYHTALIRTIDEARDVYRIARDIAQKGIAT